MKKKVTEGSLTLTATAADMTELNQMLKLAGLEPQEMPCGAPEVEVEAEPAEEPV